VKAERLKREFADRAVSNHASLLLLRPADAIELISRAAEEGVPVLGIDGARATATSAGPPLDRIADFSSAVASGHGCWQDAETVIRERGDLGLVFDLALGDDPIEAV
jgi:hypothetical protein